MSCGTAYIFFYRYYKKPIGAKRQISLHPDTLILAAHMKETHNDKNPLSRYFEILNGKRKPGYVECKSKKIVYEDSVRDNDLWALHDWEAHKMMDTVSEKSFLDLKIELTKRILANCRLCGRRCGVDRLGGKGGHCGVLQSKISSEFLHHGEEAELIPSYTIFFAGCTFNCVFCQNHDISQNPENGIDIEPARLAEMIEKRSPYCRNVNWVGGDPTPNLLYILETLKNCNASLPQIWNSNMYMSEECMKLLDGVIDVYLSDFKYGNDKCAKRLSNVDNFFEVVSRNHKIANKQCEMLIRHLVMPNHVECCSKPVLDWIAGNLRNVEVNVMAQYRPEYNAHLHKDIDRGLKSGEFLEARRYAEKLGLDLE